MSALKFPAILFFLADAMPTIEEQLAADELAPARVMFRNARRADQPGALEHCDGVAGAVPAAYAKAYPTAEEAISNFMEKRAAYFEQRKKDIETSKLQSAEIEAKRVEAENKQAGENAAKAQDYANAKAAEAEQAQANLANAQNGAPANNGGQAPQQPAQQTNQQAPAWTPNA